MTITSRASRAVPFSVRPFCRADLPGVLELFEAAFGRPISETHYRWKLLAHDAPFDNIWLAAVGDKIIGQYACTPMRFKLRDRVVWAAHGCDVMTAPDFRRMGVLTALGTSANAAWRRGGLAFTTGLHYEGSWGSRRHYLGWRPQFPMGWRRRALRLDRLAARRRVPRPLAFALGHGYAAWNRLIRRATPGVAGLEVREVPAAGVKFDDLWQHVSPKYEATVVRDRAWVAYRYFAATWLGYRVLLAEREGDPAGYLAFRNASAADGSGVIADVFAGPGDPAATVLIAHATERLRAAGAEQVRALVPLDTAIAASFRRAGFLPAPGRFDASIVPLAASELEPLRDSSRWFTMGGDFDVV
jgi:Acetyltransferase (GNAT) domain